MTAVYVLLILLAIIAVLYMSGGLAISVYMHLNGKRTNDQIVEYEVAEKGFDIKLLDIPHESFFIHSRFGYRLHARFYKAEKPTHKYIIDIHGRSSSSISQMKYLKIFTDMGYNVLLPDQRYSGESGGRFFSFGFYEKHDIMSWITILKQKDEKAEFALFGESMGGATATLVASMDDRIKALISYCSFSSVRDIVLSHTGKEAPSFLKYFLPAYYVAMLLFFGIRVSQVNIVKAMSKIKIPTLISHSYGDELVPINHAKKLIAANENAEVLLFEGDVHARVMLNHGEEFTKTVQGFLKRSGF
jgi:alpha-beta hydrolase superfamily lysophospholipase